MPKTPAERGSKIACALLGSYALVGGFVSFLGWAADIPRLASWDNNGVAIQPNTTIAVMAAGCALLLLTYGVRQAAVPIAALAGLLGATALFQHLSGVNLHIDTLFMFDRDWGRRGVISPGRMGPAGATSWSIIGLALVFASVGGRPRRFVPALALLTTGIATLSLVGYLYGASVLYLIPTTTIIAMQTSTFILAVSLGLIMSVPERGPMRLFAADSVAGMLARRIVPALVILPIVVGYLRLRGERAGMYDTAFGSALRTLTEIAIFLFLLWWTARTIGRQAEKRERAEKALAAKEKQLQHVTDNAAVLVSQCTRDLRFVYVNKPSAEFIGRPPHEIIGKPIVEIIGPAALATVQPFIDRVLNGERVEYEVEIPFASVGARFMRVVYVPDRDSSGAVCGWVGASTDLTDRRAAEQAVAEDLKDTQLLRELGARSVQPNASLDEMLGEFLDAAIAITHADKGNVQLFEIESKSLKIAVQRGFEEPFLQFFDTVRDEPSVCGVAMKARQRTMAGDVTESPIFLGAPSLAVLREANVRAVQSTPLISSTDQLLGMISTHFHGNHTFPERDLRLLDLLARQLADFIERKKNEEALALSQSELESQLADAELLQRLSAELVQEGNVEALYEMILDAAVSIMDSDFGSMQMVDHQHGSDWQLKLLTSRGFGQAAQDLWSRVTIESNTSCGEALRVGKRILVPDCDSSDFTFGPDDHAMYRELGMRSIQSTPLVSRSGNVLGMISTHWKLPHQPSERDLRLFDILARQAADLLERRTLELQREKLLLSEQEARETAEQANSLKDEFLATLSHELRNPLNVILGYSELLLRTPQIAESEKLRRMSEALKRNAQSQSQLINDLLDLSRLQMGKLSLNKDTVSLANVVTSSIETIQAEAKAKQLTIEVTVPETFLLVEGDPLRLQQVVWNLLNNAVKFTPAGGTINIVLKAEDEEAVLSIEDTGQGISPEFLPHVFQMFRQADSGTARRHEGLGIGLALVQQLVRLSGGTVSADSKGQGQGACFTIRLPARASREIPPKFTSELKLVSLTDMGLLVIDDSEDTVIMLQKLLELSGATVRTAKSGKEALQLVQEQQFDVILSDVSMPEMDGYEFLRRLRSLPGLDDVPVLALTGFGRSEDIERAKSAGFFSHITKPFDLHKLAKTLQSVPKKRSRNGTSS